MWRTVVTVHTCYKFLSLPKWPVIIIIKDAVASTIYSIYCCQDYIARWVQEKKKSNCWFVMYIQIPCLQCTALTRFTNRCINRLWEGDSTCFACTMNRKRDYVFLTFSLFSYLICCVQVTKLYWANVSLSWPNQWQHTFSQTEENVNEQQKLVVAVCLSVFREIKYLSVREQK